MGPAALSSRLQSMKRGIVFVMDAMTLSIIGIIVLIVMLFLGVNIGLGMLFVGFVGYLLATTPTAAIGQLKLAPFTIASNYSFCVIPLFIIMGNFAFASGISDGLFNCGNKFLSRLPGGLAWTTIVVCALFGAICGSTAATAATMGVLAIPAMRKYGYDDGLACGTISVGGTLGIMIPPSTPFIVYGIMAEESIGRLFAAGVFPGILLALLCCITITIRVKRNPSLAPDTNVKYPLKEKLASLKGLIWFVVLFGIVLGGMFSGFFSINESAAVGAAAAIIITAIKRRLTWRVFIDTMKDSVKTAAMTYIILIGADMFGKFLAITKLPMNLANYIEGLDVSRYVILLFIVIIYAIMGCLMDALPMVTLTVPIFLPIVTGLGFDPIWFGVIIVLVIELGLITPPVGLNCYIIAGIAKDVPLSKIFKGSLPFVFPILIAIVLVTIFPQIATFLPTLFYG